MKFSDLPLEPSLSTAIARLNYSDCTPIQAAAMPLILEGKDVAGLAQTGTGKTAAFLIPLMDRILQTRANVVAPPAAESTEGAKPAITKRSFGEWKAGHFVLILVPTRELAEQVQENIEKLSVESGLKGFAIYGGTGYDKQKEAVKNGLDFIVATPGRLIDLYKEHVVDLKQVRAIVFDEADRMFDMGFKDDMKFILSRIPRERQFLVFSATLNFDVLNTAYQFGAEPVEIDVSRDQTKAENVKDEIFHVGQEDKPSYLLSILKKHNPSQAIVFSNFKHNVDRLARFLSANGVPAVGISSLLTQAQRNRVMEQFKGDNEKNILVATDVAARGLDIKGVDMVINYELPGDSESYVHRIGRTGRAGAEGRAFSLVSDMDVEALERIQDYLKHKLEVGWLEDQDIIKDFKPVPSGHDSPGGRPRPQREGGHPRRNERGSSRGPGGGRERRHPGSHAGAPGEHRKPRAHGAGAGAGAGPGSHHPRRNDRGESRREASGGKEHPHSKPGSRPHDRSHHRGPRHEHRKTSAARPVQKKAPASSPSVMAKVKGFFKNLFG